MEKSRPSEHEFLDPEEWESWGALMMLHRSVLQGLDGELRRHHGLAVTEFDVLITLFNAPDKRTILQRNTDLNTTTFGRITEIQSPRVWRFGAKVSF